MEKNKKVPKLRFPEFTGEWEEKKLGEIAEKRILKNNNSHFKNVFTNSAVYGIINQRDFFDKDIANQDNINGYYIVEKDDFVYNPRISTSAPVGPISRNKLGTGVMSPLYSVFRFKKGNLDFIEWFFRTTYWHRHMEDIANYGARADRMSFAISDFYKMPVPDPVPNEQSRIASFLTAVDKKLTQLKKKKTLLEQYKKGVMQKLFSQELRFKDNNNQDFPDWQEKIVENIFKITRGNVLSMTLVMENQDAKNRYPVYSSQTRNKGLSGYYDKFLFENCITWTTDGAGAGDVNFRKGKFYCTNVCGVLISDEGYANQFVAELLNSISRKYVSYVGNPKLMNNVMGNISICIPSSIIEQQKIATFLSAIDEKISHSSTQIEKMETWKKGLLQQMFC